MEDLSSQSRRRHRVDGFVGGPHDLVSAALWIVDSPASPPRDRVTGNGALVSNIVIDTSTAATDTIDYVATDAAGNTATSTRTVIIEAAPSIAPPTGATTPRSWQYRQ
jgi:hypothetical protein